MIKEILTTYWSQSVLIILGIAYFVKRLFDSKAKKIEIKYSLFQQNRIIAVNTFFLNYAKVEFMWHKLPYYAILNHKMTPEEIDEIIWPPLYDLKKSIFELKIYFDANEHKYFNDLYENFLSLNGNLLEATLGNSEEKNTTKKYNSFAVLRNNVFVENNKIINEITNMVRKSYT